LGTTLITPIIRTGTRLALWPALTLASFAFDLGSSVSNPLADRLWDERHEPPACSLARLAMQAHDVFVLLFRPDPAYFREDRPNAYLLALEEQGA
jgi:hypothetical protein